MTKLYVGKAMRYQLDYMIKASLWFAAIVAVISIVAALIITAVSDGTVPSGLEALYLVLPFNIHISGYYNYAMFGVGATMLFFIFIVGIAGIREDLRFFNQNGMGHTTTYLSSIFISLIVGAAAAIFGEILNVVYNNWAAFPATGLRFPFEGNFALNWLVSTVCYFAAWQFGSLWSLAYFRMSKTVTIVFTASIIAIFIFAIPNAIGWIFDTLFSAVVDTGTIEAGITGFFSNPVNVLLVALVQGVIYAIANFFLLRGAQVKVSQ